MEKIKPLFCIILLMLFKSSLAQIAFFACPRANNLMYQINIENNEYQLSGKVVDIKQTGNEFMLTGKSLLGLPSNLASVSWKRDHMNCSYINKANQQGKVDLITLHSQAEDSPVLSYCHFKNSPPSTHHCYGTQMQCVLKCEIL